MAKGAALITGASSGIGAELARLCAADGFDVTLVARGRAELQTLAAELERAHRIAAHTLVADLSDPAAPDAILAAAPAAAIDILVNNAGFGRHGPFALTDWDTDRRLLEVNMAAPARLMKLYLPAMLARRSGRILNVASTAAFVPGPFMAMYYASKAYLLSLSEAVANEVRGSGVTVTALCPGPTRTRFGATAGVTETNLFKGASMDAAEVARIGYRAMMAGLPEVIAGARNRWVMRGARLIPRTVLANVTRRLNST